jgi:hypothetical protein
MIMGGFYYSSSEETHPLRYEDVLSMLKDKSISLPTEEEIQDRSKSDWLAKTIALLQTLWFVMQCIGRHIEHLPTTQLEIITLAYTVINLGMVIAWWHKPRNVDCAIRVLTKPEAEGKTKKLGWFNSMLNFIEGSQDGQVNLQDETEVPRFYSGKPGKREIYIANCITLFTGVAFGAVHCIAWSFDFPSHTERFLWRLSCIAITAVPALLSLSIGTGYLASKVSSGFLTMVIMPFFWIPFFLAPVLGVLYVAARLTTVALAFINLASLPPGALQAVQWTTLIPHL